MKTAKREEVLGGRVAVVSFPAMVDQEEPTLLSLWFGFPSFLW
jgi:hypothetical protein